MCFSTLTFSQSKKEKEKRIDASDFPQTARHYFNDISQKVKHLRFYKETDGDKHSFEVKFKINKLHYSVEFDTLGKLEDIELIIKEKHIPKALLKTIRDYFKLNFDKIEFIKIQKQYVNNTQLNDKQFLFSIINHPEQATNAFEIIAEIKKNGNRQIKEFTFKNNGEFEKSRVVKSEDYQYALY